jgi:hypothetical protein
MMTTLKGLLENDFQQCSQAWQKHSKAHIKSEGEYTED